MSVLRRVQFVSDAFMAEASNRYTAVPPRASPATVPSSCRTIGCAPCSPSTTAGSAEVALPQRCPGILTRCPRAGSCATVASGDAPDSRSTTAFQRQTSAPRSEALLRSASGPGAVPGRVCPNVRPTTGDRSSYASDGSPNVRALWARHPHRRPGRAPGSRHLDRSGLTTIDADGAVVAGGAPPSQPRRRMQKRPLGKGPPAQNLCAGE